MLSGEGMVVVFGIAIGTLGERVLELLPGVAVADGAELCPSIVAAVCELVLALELSCILILILEVGAFE